MATLNARSADIFKIFIYMYLIVSIFIYMFMSIGLGHFHLIRSKGHPTKFFSSENWGKPEATPEVSFPSDSIIIRGLLGRRDRYSIFVSSVSPEVVKIIIGLIRGLCLWRLYNTILMYSQNYHIHMYLKVKFCNLKKCFEYFVFIFFWFIYIYVYACTANYLFRVVDSCKQDYVSFIKKKSLK